MSAETLLQYLNWLVFLVIFASTLLQAIRRPLPANIDIALLFGVPALVILIGLLSLIGSSPMPAWLNAVSGSLILSISYLLLRLVDDFATVPVALLASAPVLLVALCVPLFVVAPPLPGWLTALQIAYFVLLQLYAGIAFVRAARQVTGVTRRRLRAAATGSVLLGVDIIVLGLTRLGSGWMIVSGLAGLGTGISYFVGFAPPALLRRAWQEPELRAFLGRAALLPRLPTTQAIIEEVELGAATALGAHHASVGLLDAGTQQLHFVIEGDLRQYPVKDDYPAGQAFVRQKPVFSPDTPRDYPQYAAVSRASQSTALLIAPITAGKKRLGVLTVSSPRMVIFAEDDLALVQLLADQAAVVLESRALIDEAARVHAREEATRLKDDFLSAAAHDLKTPLTTLVAQAQLMERRALRRPDAPADINGLQRLVKEALRLRSLVLDLLDASRVEQGQLVGRREEADLTAVVREACSRHDSARHTCTVEAVGPVIGMYDPQRIGQLIENLIENAVKYSPDGGNICIHVWEEATDARLTVSDQGIGIPPADLPTLFERFHRGSNVDDRRFAGMGLGLFICRGIVEQHGGRIWTTSELGQGTTFHIALPRTTG
ncbi:MAG: GAF domain-containing protein [Herpetosiphonaceae bacterium]|nr:GAF domain-containing protein [Herpetosiphonaceae bacterium]